MGEWIKLKASDGFELSAWRADPRGTPRGGIVVIQEIFGVNHHIRSVTDRFAAEGYLAIAPAVFDRAEPGVELGYDPPGIASGMELAGKLVRETSMQDVAAAIEVAAEGGKVGITGFCMGGTYTWGASARLPGLAAAVGYYGGGILGMKDLRPLAPTMLHFGEKDDHIPVAGVRELEALHPDVPVYVYPAGHG
jgi:carboxymethylenebutenolidase